MGNKLVRAATSPRRATWSRGSIEEGRRRPIRYRGLLSVVATAALVASATGTALASNRKNLKKLAIGMTSDEVDDVMGSETYSHENSSTETTGSKLRRRKKQRIPNPYRTEAHQTEEHSFIVLLYYTDMKTRDGRITDDEMTPVILKDGLVDGWGWDHWDGLVEKYRIGALPPTPVPNEG